MGGISFWQLVIVAIIVVLLFGTRKLRSLGSDLGSAVKGFKDAVDDSSASAPADSDVTKPQAQQNQSAAKEKQQD